jgi:surfeit locus 1 family protein
LSRLVEEQGGVKPFPYVAAVLAVLAFAALIALGTWQVERLHWKEALLATIDHRIHSTPRPLSEIERLFAEKHDVEYWPVTVKGTFLHAGERHFLATWQGDAGFDIYTPLKLDDGRYLFVNRGFVPYDRKEPASRAQGEVKGEVTVTGLARNPLAQKPSFIVPDNQPTKNIFYWKDLSAMTATAGLPAGAKVLPFFVDANDAPNPGGLPVGGVTLINLPNNHFQYALTWYGLALVLLVVAVTRLTNRWRGAREGAGNLD